MGEGIFNQRLQDHLGDLTLCRFGFNLPLGLQWQFKPHQLQADIPVGVIDLVL